MKKFAVYFTKLGEADLEAIFEFIAQDNPSRALSFIDEITAHIQDQLANFPHSGVKHRDDIYKLVFKKTVIIYYRVLEDKKQVDIVHIKRSYKPM